MKTNAELPVTEAQRLAKLRSGKQYEQLYSRTLALRAIGWPLRAIAEPLGVSRMAVSTWEDRAIRRGLEKDDKDIPMLPLDAIGSPVRAVRKPIDVPKAEREMLATLAASARQVRRWTPADAQERKDAAKLDLLLVKHIEDRQVQPMLVARHANVTRRAVMARLERFHERANA